MNNKIPMRLLLLSVGPILSVGLLAQDVPKVGLFVGYSYLRTGGVSNAGLVGLGAVSLNGWDASAKFNVTSRIGLLADFSGQYGDRRVQLPAASNPALQPRPGDFRQHTFLFGPEFRVLGTDRIAVNLRALAGVANRNTLVAPLSQPIESTPPLIGNPATPITQLTVSGGNGFAASFGGSIDYRINDRLAYRFVQPEPLLTRFAGSTQPDFRVATGLVFTFGRL
jgi:hypothetical protein